ncbi:MAG: hypothetical protein GY850_41440 [bacterium]|nr:hypothetical protein [bacterium]
MMEHFPYITIENNRYPTVILGGDRFTGIFGNPRNTHLENVITTPEYISTIFEACYQRGFRGYDISMSDPVIACFIQLKEKYPDCIGIGNPNWDCGLMIGKRKLREIHPRINAHFFKHVFSVKEKAAISQLCPDQREVWFSYPSEATPLTSQEIASIYVDEEKYQANLDKIKEICEFCLVGTVFADWLPLLGRQDILRDVIALVRDNKLIPLSIHHWTSLVLPLLDELDVAGHWTYLNKACQFLTEGDAIQAIQHSQKPITAFKALLSREKEDIEAYFDYVFHVAHIQAVDFGVETTEEAHVIATILQERFFHKHPKISDTIQE